MTTQQINNMLYRPLKTGFDYEALFPNSSCESKMLNKGNTKVALSEMRKWAIKYTHHSEKVASKFLGKDLKETTRNIQYFLFNHFQYAIDESDQLLRSPGCAWQTRQQGIDCKSYSIIASTILLNLGIKHSLRRIVQAQMPEAYTHVYVVIPIVQTKAKISNTAQFGKDYFIIDGTIKENNELPFIKKDDVQMNEPKLAIYGLAAPGLGCGSCGNECGCKQNNYDSSNYPEGMAISFGDFSNIFGNDWAPSCIGGTYDKNDLERMLNLTITGFDTLFANFNSKLSNLQSTNSNTYTIELDINTILQSAAALFKKASRMAVHDWNSSCSRKTSEGFRDVAAYYLTVAEQVFLPYLAQYFNFNTSIVDVPNGSYAFETRSGGVGMKKNEFGAGDAPAIQLSSLSVLDNVQIPLFEITAYAVENAGEAGFNLNSFLNTLTQIGTTIGVIDGGSGSNGNGSTTGGNTSGSGSGGNGTPPPPKSNASSGLIVTGILAVAAGAYWYTNKNKKQNA